MIDIQVLRILREIEQSGSISAAGTRLFMSQSAISHAVRRYENRFGVRLLRKEGRGVQLSDAGAYLATVSNRIVPQILHAESVLKQFASGNRGSLRIGMECHPCQQWLTRVLQRFLQDWADVEVDVTSDFRFGGIAAVLNHEIDVLITPDPVQHRELVYEEVFDYELVLATPIHHHLAGKKHVLPQELSAETLITYPVPTDRLDVFTKFMLPAGCLPRRHKMVETTDLMLQLVATGRGVSAVPDWLLREISEGKNVAAARFGRDGIQKSISIGLRSDDVDLSYVSGFIQSAKSTRGQ